MRVLRDILQGIRLMLGEGGGQGQGDTTASKLSEGRHEFYQVFLRVTSQ